MLLAALRTCRFEVGCLDQIMFRIHGQPNTADGPPSVINCAAADAVLCVPCAAADAAFCVLCVAPDAALCVRAPSCACAPLQTPPPALCAPLKTPSPAFCAPQAPPPPAFCTPLLAGRFIGRRGDLWQGRRDRLLGLSFRHCKQSGSRCEAE